jgi:aryl sulfotransferase
MAGLQLPERKYIYNNMTTDSRRWDGFKPRSGDVIISTPPKCGTTWTQMICALLIFQKTKFERRLTDYTPWLDMVVAPIAEILREYESQTHQRFINTHTPLDGIPYFENVTYLFVARGPRDAFISMGSHFGNMRPEAVAAIMKSAQELNVPLRMRAPDVRDAFRDWITASGVPVNEAVRPQLVAAADFSEMKSNAEILASIGGAGKFLAPRNME